MFYEFHRGEISSYVLTQLILNNNWVVHSSASNQYDVSQNRIH